MKVKKEEFSICSEEVVRERERIIQYKRDLLSKSVIRKNLERKVRSVMTQPKTAKSLFIFIFIFI